MKAPKKTLSNAWRFAAGGFGGLMLATASHAAVVMHQAASAEITANGSTVSQGSIGGSADAVGAMVSAPNFTFQPTDSTGGAYAVGFSSGYFYTSAYGAGQFDARSVFAREWTITNDTGVQQAYNFSFHVPAGQLIAYTDSAGPLDFGGDGFARYLINVVLNSTTDLYASGVTLFGNKSTDVIGSALMDALETVQPTNGAHPGFDPLFKRYSWGDTSISVPLGILDPGKSLTLAYSLEAQAFGNYNFISASDCLYPLDTSIGFDNQCTGKSQAFIGDPNGIDSLPAPSITAVAAPVQAVPEPGTWALLGLGLGLVTAVRRRRTR
jgi:hypothetical protein